MESLEATLTYLQTARKIAYHRDGKTKHPDWTEERWLAVPYHWENGGKYYHSYADYCWD